jgi:molybdopterin converting factor small subunit
MPVTIRLASQLSHFAAGTQQVEVEAGTVDEALAALERRHPGLRSRFCDANGRLKLFVRVFVGDQDIRLGAGQATILRDGDHLEILPAIAGGV